MDTVICVSRQYGSGGRIFAEKLANHYGIPLYDKEIIEKTAQKSGISKEHFEKADEKRNSSFLLTMIGTQYGMSAPLDVNHIITDDKLFVHTAETIRELAKEPCVILGRCADDILNGQRKLLRIFICANIPNKVASIMKRFEGITEKQALSLMKKQDKHRANYYNYYTGKNWGEADNYDVCINTSQITLDECVLMIDGLLKTEKFN